MKKCKKYPNQTKIFTTHVDNSILSKKRGKVAFIANLTISVLTIVVLGFEIHAQQSNLPQEQASTLFRILDGNRDNQLTREEVTGELSDNFALADSNADGGIDIEELSTFLELASQNNDNVIPSPRVGFEILNFTSPEEIKVWISRGLSIEEFNELQLPLGWTKNQPREGDPDRSRFLRSPDAEVDGPLSQEEYFGSMWMHNATVIENNIPVNSEALLKGNIISKFHELTYLSGRKTYILVSPDDEYYIRVSRDLNRTSEIPTVPYGWKLIEHVLSGDLTFALPNPTLNIRADNEDSFQGPLSATVLGLEDVKTIFLDRIIAEDDIVVTSDIWFGGGEPNSGQPLYLDVYEPVSPMLPAKRPALVYIHGGAFRLGDKADQPAPLYCREFAGRGYVVFSINYTLDGTLKSATLDAAKAIRWVRENANTYIVDVDRIIAGGHSAGGVTSFNLGVLESDDIGGEGAEVAGVFNAAGGGLVDLNELDIDDPPILVINGTEDNLSPVESARNIISSFDRLGDQSNEISYPYSYIEVEGAGHSFIPGLGLGITPLPIAGSPQDEFKGWCNTEVQGKTVDRHCFEFFFEHLNLVEILNESPNSFERKFGISDESEMLQISIQYDNRIEYDAFSSSDLKSWDRVTNEPALKGMFLELEFPITEPQMFHRWELFHDYREVTSSDYDTF